MHKVIHKYPQPDFRSDFHHAVPIQSDTKQSKSTSNYMDRKEQQLLCACCWYEEVRTATTKGTQTFQLGILDDGNMPGPMV